jgi:hypothetical protein
MLSIYDECVVRFFKQVKWYGREVPVVLAAPDRAFSQIKDWLTKARGEKMSSMMGEKTTPFPFIAVWIDPYQEDSQLFNPNVIRDIGVNPESGYGYAMRAPLPVTAGVSVNIYTDDMRMRRFIEYQLFNLFPQKLGWITVDFGDPKWYTPPDNVMEFAKILGEQKLRFMWESLSDNSTIEDSGLGDRSFRMTLSLTLHALIPFQPYAVPIARGLKFCFSEYETELELGTVEVEKD